MQKIILILSYCFGFSFRFSFSILSFDSHLVVDLFNLFVSVEHSCPLSDSLDLDLLAIVWILCVHSSSNQ